MKAGGGNIDIGGGGIGTQIWGGGFISLFLSGHDRGEGWGGGG